ncbi:MAG: hypothetical protein LBF40_10090 [Deltaproteobacteria bacterium]|jgi:hypothetical protein|nr:hypothetical protein [Deltaproteobacteria bacterium]
MAVRLLTLALLITGVLSALIAGCQSGPFEPHRMEAMRARSAYVALAREHTTHDEIFFFDELRASVILDVLNMGPRLLSAARVRWAADGFFTDAMGKWLPEGEGRVIFVGIYARGFKVSEFSEKGSYRVRLRSQGTVYEPDVISEVKEPLLSNYLPVFNQWEKVFACHFPAPPAPGATVVIEFPQGTRELALTGDGA